jgi:hypothetical protein
MTDFNTPKTQDSNKETTFQQSLLTSDDIADLLQWYRNTLENKSLLLADASKSSDEKKFYDAYGYAALVAAMDRTEWDKEIYSKVNHNAWYYGQQLLKQNADPELFADVLAFFDKALMMRYDDAHKHQVTTNMYVATIKDYIQNTSDIEKLNHTDLIVDALSKAQISISKNNQDSEVRMVCTNLASLLFNEAKRVDHKNLAQLAHSFNQESINWAKTEIAAKRMKLQGKIKKYLEDTEFWENYEDTEDYDNIISLAERIINNIRDTKDYGSPEDREDEI